jgi:DNA-binding PadR family transcriptional regulator
VGAVPASAEACAFFLYRAVDPVRKGGQLERILSSPARRSVSGSLFVIEFRYSNVGPVEVKQAAGFLRSERLAADEMKPRKRKAAVPAEGPDLYAGLIRLHILHHAAKEPFYGLWLIEELGHHGYRLSPGTLYPMLHRLEHQGYLRSQETREGRRVRRLYRATPEGRKALRSAREKVRELFGELFEE